MDTLTHDLLIASHAASGIIGFTLGCLVIDPRFVRFGKKFKAYYTALVGLVVFMVSVVAYDWTRLDMTQHLVFSGLILLGLYTFWRGHQASCELRIQTGDWKRSYIDHVGFTLISLFDAFTIVAAIDLGAPGLVVAIVAVLGVLAGIAGIKRVMARAA